MQGSNFTVVLIMIITIVITTSQATSNSKFDEKCTSSQDQTYRVALQFCDGRNWRNVQSRTKTFQGRGGRAQGTSCLDIKNKGLSNGDGEYMIDPDRDGQDNAFVVYCDMTSFGGGWTMCYTTNSHVNIKTELTTNLAHGYRANCNYIPFSGVIFIDEKSKQKTAFSKSGPSVTFVGNYDKNADTYGVWTAQGVASQQFKYQMLICDTTFYKGLHFSGYTKGCYKKCDRWCSDLNSPYFRTAAVSAPSYTGVAFNENGHSTKPNRLISVGIR